MFLIVHTSVVLALFIKLYSNRFAAVYFLQLQQQLQLQAAASSVMASGAPPSQPLQMADPNTNQCVRPKRQCALCIVNPDKNQCALIGEEVPPSAAHAIAAWAEQTTAVVGDKAGSDEPASSVPHLVPISVQEETPVEQVETEIEQVETEIEQVETEIEPVSIGPADQVVEAAGQVEAEKHPVEGSIAISLPPVEAVVAVEEKPSFPLPQK